MDGKAGFIILVAIVAFLSLTIALLAGYVFFNGGQTALHGETNKTSTEDKQLKVEYPKEEELGKERLFEEKDNKKFYNLKPDVNGKPALLQVSAELIYFREVPGIKKPLEKLMTNKAAMRELVNKYFQNVTIEQVSSPEGRDKIKADVVKSLNEMLTLNEETKNDIIYNIVFDDWFYQ